MLFFNSKIANLASTNLKSLFFIFTLSLIVISGAHEANHGKHSAQSFSIDSIESQEKIRSFFKNYTNNQSLMNSTQVNTFLENFIKILEHHDLEHHEKDHDHHHEKDQDHDHDHHHHEKDQDHDHHHHEKDQDHDHHHKNKRDATLSNDQSQTNLSTSHNKCIREYLSAYKQNATDQFYLNETNFNKLSTLILNDIHVCLTKTETQVNSYFKSTKIIINTKS
jgi:hypothetical protein